MQNHRAEGLGGGRLGQRRRVLHGQNPIITVLVRPHASCLLCIGLQPRGPRDGYQLSPSSSTYAPIEVKLHAVLVVKVVVVVLCQNPSPLPSNLVQLDVRRVREKRNQTYPYVVKFTSET